MVVNVVYQVSHGAIQFTAYEELRKVLIGMKSDEYDIYSTEALVSFLKINVVLFQF